MRIAVLGAGVTGLTAAYRLGREGHACDVYERWPGLGGQVATLDIGDGHLLERYYHHLFTSDEHIAALYDELAMDDAIEWLPSSVAMFADGRSYPFTTPLDLLRFKPLSLRSRARMGIGILLLQRRNRELGRFESQTARAWIERTLGSEVWETVWGPLLRGKFGDRADDITMAWLWKKLTVRRRIKGVEARREVLGYPRGGWQPLLDRLAAEIERAGGRVLIDRPAAAVELSDGGLLVAPAPPESFRRGHDPRKFERAGEPQPYEAVVVTAPNDVFEQLLGERARARVGDEYVVRLQSIEYHAALCLLLELDRRFSSFYWTNVADPELPFVGLIEQTNLIPPQRYGGRHLLYVANYVARQDPVLDLSPDDLLARYEPGLRRVNGGFNRDWVRRMWLFSEPAAQPVVTVGYRERIPAMRTGVPGLYLANTTQIYPEDRGTNYSVRLGSDVAALVAADAGERR
jgi:protoporphyrinogen oxidase